MLRPVGLALFVIVAGCGDADPPDAAGDANTVTAWLGTADDSAGFAKATRVREFRFPEDHGPHPDYRTEWWYFTGNLEASDGRHFGFQLTFFRFALRPDDHSGGWSDGQVWMAHFALTDTAGGRFHAFERFERPALGMAGASVDPLRIWLQDWEARGNAGALLPLTLSAAEDGVGIELTLDGGRGIVLQGDRGLDPKGPEPGNASYYYSLTRLDAGGTVQTPSGRHAVSGSAWLDREWSTSVLGDDVTGWDWFAIQLDSGHDVMLYRLRMTDGGTSPFSGGVIVAPDGRVERRLGADDFALQPLRTWSSPASGVTYPVAWRIRLDGEATELELDARLDAQELDVTVRYWEGAMRVGGEFRGEPANGSAYTELAGPRNR